MSRVKSLVHYGQPVILNLGDIFKNPTWIIKKLLKKW